MTIYSSVWKDLTLSAIEAAEHSTAESHCVGAAIMDEQGMFYNGANFEANNHRSTIHAEDAAIASMLMSRKDARALLLVTVAADYDESGELGEFYYTYPCGSCRNILFEVTEYGDIDELQVWWDREPPVSAA